jgi:predicted  nucleic acid-binding Zn-ribbon protein
MRADVGQQRFLLELAELDAALSRIGYRATHLAEQRDYEQIREEYDAATDRLAAARMALEDLNTEISRLESEIDAVQQRERRDSSMLDSGATNAKQVTDLQHELETLARRRSSLEDSLLELMERREELTSQETGEAAAIDRLQAEMARAQQVLDAALAEIEKDRGQRLSRREELTAALDPELAGVYERQRAAGGAGAGPLQGRRCGACRLEIDRGELARISAAAEDEVLRCPECSAILLRIQGTGQ